ncbi:MAG: DNA alkylation repair protein [Candidatus Aminicenantaceae bacterium]
MRVDEIQKKLETLGNEKAVAGMARFGITAQTVYGVSMPKLRALAKEIGKDHDRALELWRIPNRETRILAGLTADRTRVDDALMEDWVRDFDSWEICDQTLLNLFDRTPLAAEKAEEWSFREEEFVKRAGYVLMARLATVDKQAGDDFFRVFFPHIQRGAADERNYVKKAVNWALRQIGKRNLTLNRMAITQAETIQALDSHSARWVANDALRELRSEAVQERLLKKQNKG